MTDKVNAVERRRDRAALGIVGLGAFVYLVSFLGMRTMATVPIVYQQGHPSVRRFTYLWELSRAGLAIALVGALAMTWSYWRYRSRQKDAP